MTGRSRQKILAAAWLVFAASFVAYLLSADRVYQALSGKPTVARRCGASPQRARGDLQVLPPFEFFLVNNRFEERVGLQVRVNSIINESGRARASIFFRSADAVYEFTGQDAPLLVAPQHGVVKFTVSTAAFERGVYTVGLQLIDDTGERFVWLNCHFEKAAGGPAEYVARPVAVVPGTASRDVKFDIESVVTIEEKQLVCIRGWIVLENADMDDYSAYIAVRDAGGAVKAFYAPLYTRMDIASRYADARAANSGFEINIPRDAIAPGKHAVKVVLKSRKTGDVVESEQEEIRSF